MSPTAKQLEAAALSLPREERVLLAEMLIASLDRENSIDEAWFDEIRCRLTSYQQNQLQVFSLDHVLKDARARFTSD